MSRIILEIESLYKTYGEKENAAEALRGISFQVYQGEFLGIMGSSGSGKTTLLNCIASVLRPTRGRILLKGQDIGMYTDASWQRIGEDRSGICFSSLNCWII